MSSWIKQQSCCTWLPSIPDTCHLRACLLKLIPTGLRIHLPFPYPNREAGHAPSLENPRAPNHCCTHMSALTACSLGERLEPISWERLVGAFIQLQKSLSPAESRPSLPYWGEYHVPVGNPSPRLCKQAQ